jgi:SAM-dependent methyltransferase
MAERPRDPAREEPAGLAYHLAELAVALDPSRPEHLMPRFAPHHRRVLDVGCGAGQTLVAAGYADATDDRLACGVDVDAPVLAAGQARWPRLALAAARGEALPWADATFDLVVSRVAVPYMDVPAALAEAFRVLRPGGELWLALHGLPMALGDLRAAVARRAWRAAAFRAYVLVNGAALQVLGRTFPFALLPQRPVESWQGERGMRLALRRAGFEAAAFSGTSRAPVVRARRPPAAGA